MILVLCVVIVVVDLEGVLCGEFRMFCVILEVVLEW